MFKRPLPFIAALLPALAAGALIMLAAAAPSPAPASAVVPVQAPAAAGGVLNQGTRMHVGYVHVYYDAAGGFQRQGYVDIAVRDEFNNPVNGARVTGNWSGCLVENGATGITQTWYENGEPIADGVAVIKTKKKANCRAGCSFHFAVTSITATGMTYDPASNTVSSGSTPCF